MRARARMPWRWELWTKQSAASGPFNIGRVGRPSRTACMRGRNIRYSLKRRVYNIAVDHTVAATSPMSPSVQATSSRLTCDGEPRRASSSEHDLSMADAAVLHRMTTCAQAAVCSAAYRLLHVLHS